MTPDTRLTAVKRHTERPRASIIADHARALLATTRLWVLAGLPA